MFGSWHFPNTRQTGEKIPHPKPKFRRVPLPGEKSNPGPVKILIVFPIPAPYFGQMNPRSREYLSRLSSNISRYGWRENVNVQSIDFTTNIGTSLFLPQSNLPNSPRWGHIKKQNTSYLPPPGTDLWSKVLICPYYPLSVPGPRGVGEVSID